MHCDICGKNEAVVHYAEVVNGKMKKMNLCEGCAVSKGVGIHSTFSIADLLGGLTEWDKAAEGEDLGACPGCKTTYKDFKKKGRLGCPACYETFKKSLGPLLEAIHKSDHHVGKVPKKLEPTLGCVARLKKLRDDLQAAIAGEDFERAAKLRDEIKKLENKGQ
ncbi:MAG TPA: UvrB/UvrC motif-containing protein [bacterium]|nr:UvrB/UvrC motif-containing protein [bacterium]